MSTDTRIAPARTRTGLDRFFKITERGSTLGREVRGGVVTFFTMVYIVVLNPIILSGVVDGSGTMIGGTTDLTESKLLVAVGTAVIAGVMSILMGLVANFPIALAAGLGINGLITGMVITHSADKITFADLMGLVVIEGVIILVLVLTGFRKAVFKAIPAPLKVAISVGIGLFIAYIGVIDAGFARRPTTPGSVPERARDRWQPRRAGRRSSSSSASSSSRSCSSARSRARSSSASSRPPRSRCSSRPSSRSARASTTTRAR